MSDDRRRSLARLRCALCACAIVGALAALGVSATAAQAAFSEYYGGGSLCGSNCYVQSAGAHSFIVNEGWSESGSPALACQLFNHTAANEVAHGAGYCAVFYFGGEYVWARVYNQSNKTYAVTGYAET